MTDYETLAALGFTEPVAKTSEAAPLTQEARSESAGSVRENSEYPSRRSLRTAQPIADAAPAAQAAPAQPGSRRAAREAEARSAQSAAGIAAFPIGTPSVQAPPSAASFGAAPRVAAPFGTFDSAPPAGGPRASAARASAARARDTSRPRRGTAVRKRLSTVGALLLVPGVFLSLTLPAYASADYSGGAIDPAAKLDSQAFALDASSAELASASIEARDGYDSTSAADLKRLYRDALRQKRISDYLASGAMAMGDDYPWATELGMSEGGGLSPLRYFVRQCTDFVAWRLNRDAGSTRAPFKYDWSDLTPGGGSAHSWKSQWEKHGWPTSTTPAPGWVAWFPGGNHVAYVNAVLPDGSVFIEEYNWGADVYNQRIIPASSVIYLSPPPR